MATRPYNPPSWSCDGKQGFIHRDLADRILRRMRSNRIARRGTLNTYRCPHCRQWHIGGRV